MKQLLISFSFLVPLGCYTQTPYVIYKDFKISSSELMYQDPVIGKNEKYRLENLMDQDVKTAWVYEKMQPEGRLKDDNPENPSFFLVIDFVHTVQIDSIRISNGYLKSPTLYRLNNRTSKYYLHLDAEEMYLNCVDTFSLQTFEINKSTKQLKIEIIDYTLGDKYNDHCISEIQLFHNGNNLLDTKGYKVKCQAGWYSSDIIVGEDGKKMDLNTFNPGNGYTNPLISPNGNLLLYIDGGDGCESQILDIRSGKVLEIGSFLEENRLCPHEWISNSRILTKALNESYAETDNEFVVDIFQKTMIKR